MKNTLLALFVLGLACSAQAEVHQEDPFNPAPKHDVVLISGGESCFGEVCPEGKWKDHVDYYVFDHDGVKSVSMYIYNNWASQDLIDKQTHQLSGEQDAKGTFEFPMNRGDNVVIVIEKIDMQGTVSVKKKTLRAASD